MVVLVVCCVAVVLGVGAWAVLVAPYRYRLVRRSILLRGVLSGAQGITILHISDLHFRQHEEKKLRFLRSLAEHPVDFVFITGDLTEDDGGHEDCIAALRGLKGRYGTYAVLGSHDYHKHRLRDVLKHFLIRGNRSAVLKNSVDRLVAGLREAGIRVLKNENQQVDVNGDRFRIVGLEDPYLRKHDMQAAVDGIQVGEFKIMLVHTPEIVEEASAVGMNLVLAGHTHGGQVRLPVIGALVTHCGLPAQYAAGTFTLGRTTFHINNGVGCGKFTGIRFLCRPEATLLTIVGKM